MQQLGFIPDLDVNDQYLYDNIKNNKKFPLIITVSSGKGGVGKTISVIHFAICAISQGLRVLILDGDLGMSNVDVVLGLEARYNIKDVLDGHVELENIILNGPHGLKIIPSGSGIANLSHLNFVQKQTIVDGLMKLEADYDVLLIDTGAGIGDNIRHLNRISDKNIVLTTTEPHSITDAYALIKVLSSKEKKKKFDLVVNMTHSEEEAIKVYKRIKHVSKQYLNVDINYLGNVPNDPFIKKAIFKRNTFTDMNHKTLSGQAWNIISKNYLDSIYKNQSTCNWHDMK